MRRLPRAYAAAITAAILLAAGASILLLTKDEPARPPPPTSGAARLAQSDRTFTNDDPVARGCTLPRRYLERIWRGHDDAHSEDVTTVPLEPDYSGSFSVTSHSGPWDYLQRVPLVFYGPGYIRDLGEVRGAAGITDVYPTVGALDGVALERREGEVRSAMLGDTAAPPKLVLTIMWDGVGRNVLERWPDAWPNLARLEREGTSFYDATVGSSPSITPATHSSLGTGAFPRRHGVTAIEFRTDEGRVRTAFAQRDPSDLELTTFADQIDRAYGNASRVGLLGWRSWHLGMLGHGLATPGGDADELGIIGFNQEITGNPDFYETPSFLNRFTGLRRHIDELDRADGRVDGEWLGHPIATEHDNPAWVGYEADALLAMLQRGDYGRDSVPDLFFVNFKMTDIVGHQYSMDSKEMPQVLKAQDDALGRVLDYLDSAVGDYVVIVSADHGHTPSAERSGAWPVLQGELHADIDRHFGVSDGSLVDVTSAVGPFLNRDVMRAKGVTGAEVARFLNGYTIRDNWNEDALPEGYEERGDENVFQAAFASHQLPEVLDCAFDGEPPGATP